MYKISIPTLSLLAFITFSFTVLKENTVTTYKVDPLTSILKWIGKKVTGEHSGNINISSGSFGIEGNVVKSGSFDIDLSSLNVTDISDKASNEKLVNHLKSEDFFSTAKFPKATFVTTKVVSKGKEQYNVIGNLSIKGITNPIEFPASIKIEPTKVTATGKVTVNRTKYDIKFKSPSFIENLGDKAIDDNFILDFNLVAKK